MTTRKPSAWVWAPAAVIFVACLVLRWLVASRLNLADDAFITYRYAANLAAGQGFVYNAGERLLGTTSPLLTVLLALGALLHLDIPATGLWLGLAASAACCALVFDIVRVQTGGAVGGLVAAALLAASTSQAHIAASGMETALLGALMLASYRLLLSRRLLPAGVAAGLVAVTRPEGLAWLLLTVPFLRRQRRWRWAAVGLALLPLGLWLAWATWYFGSPAPHTIAIKALQGAFLGSAAPGTTLHLLLDPWGGWAIGLGLVLAGLWLAARREYRLLLIPLGFVLAFAASYALYHPTFYFWYDGPWDVSLALLLGVVTGASVSGVDLSAQASAPKAWRLGWVIASMLVVMLLLHRQSQGHSDYLSLRKPSEPRRELALWLNAHTRPGQSILVGDVGYVGYYNLGRPVYDYLGLVWRANVRDMAAVGMPISGGPLLSWAAVQLRPDCIACVAAELANNGIPAGYTAAEIPELPGRWFLRPIATGTSRRRSHWPP
jgi:hypothetical protein